MVHRRSRLSSTTLRWASLLGAALLLAVGGAAGELDGQIRLRNSQAQRLRESAALESRGDFDGAEEILRALLNEDPGSSGGLFALERVLRAKGAIVTILSAVDAFLEEDPESSGVRSLKLRVLSEADSLDAVRREAEVWMSAEPESEVPYREVSRVYERAFGSGLALELLRRGRAEIGEPDALAMEIGDLLAVTGDVEGAADEWALAVGDDAGQVATVARRVQGLTSDVDVAAARLVSALSGSDLLARRRAGARLALDLGVADQALPLVRDVSAELDGRARTTFLADVARRARDNDLVEVAAWAYDELGEVVLLDRLTEFVHPLLQIVSSHLAEKILQLLQLALQLRVGLTGLLHYLFERLHLGA